jgi:pimeloyl-ACP methyl ester carboxylesterase
MPTRDRSPRGSLIGRRRGWEASGRKRLDLPSGHVVDIVDTGAPRSSPSPSEPAVLLLHGIGMTSASLEPVARALASTHRAVCVTLPGHGSTPRPEHRMTVDDFASVAGEVADRLGLDSVIVVGQSMGSQMSVELARRRPELVAGLVLIGPVVDDRHPTAVDQALALALDSTRERVLTNLIVTRDYFRCGLRWFGKTLRSMLAYSTITRAADVTAPTIIVRGSGDPIAGTEWVSRLAGTMPDARVATLPGVHHVQLVVPDDVAALVRALANDRSGAIRQGPAPSGATDHDGNTTTLERRSNA